MTNTTSISLTVFALLEIIAGLVGSIYFVKHLMAYLVSLNTTEPSTGIAGATALVNVFMLLPSPMVLSSGIAIFISYALGKKVNNMTLGLLYFLFLLLVVFHIYTAHYSLIIWDIGIFFLSTIPLQWFMNHRCIKNLEIKQY